MIDEAGHCRPKASYSRTGITVTYCRNPFAPSDGRRVAAVRRRRRVRALAPRWHTPYIAVLNGRPILRQEWGRKVKDGDFLVFMALAAGGGGDGEGKSTLAIIAQFAMMAVMPTLGLNHFLSSALSFTPTDGLQAAIYDIGGYPV